MTVFQSIVLGIIQGLTEFLPVSSSGHLAITRKIFGLEDNMMAFDVLLHLGTLIPVFLVFWKDIWTLIKNPFQKMTFMLFIGTLPAVVLVFLLGDLLDLIFSGGLLLAFAYIITGIMLIISDSIPTLFKTKKEPSPLDALKIGTMQAVAIIPGISRSGSTITGSLLCGLNKKSAASFSFLLSIPAILGAAVLQIKDIISGESILNTISFMPLISGFLSAMISGYIAIRFMLKLLKERNLKIFSYYVFALALFIIADSLIFNLFF